MNPQQKHLYSLLGIIVLAFIVWSIFFHVSDDPRNNDWKTYFSDMETADAVYSSRNIDKLIEGIGTKCKNWSDELEKRYGRTHASGVDGYFTSTDAVLSERLKTHLRLGDELKKKHTAYQEALIDVVDNKDEDSLNFQAATEASRLKDEAEMKLKTHYGLLLKDTEAFNAELQEIQKGFLSKNTNDSAYLMWLSQATGERDHRDMGAERSAIRKAVDIILAHKKEQTRLSRDWSTLLRKLCGGTQQKGGLLQRISSCEERQSNLKPSVLRAINRFVARWMAHGEIPQVEGLVLKDQTKAGNSLDDEDVLAYVRLAVADPMFTPYIYQARKADDDAKAYLVISVDIPKEPFTEKQADYVFGATGDYTAVFADVIGKWSVSTASNGLGGSHVRCEQFKGSYYLTIDHEERGRQRDPKQLRIIVRNEKSLLKKDSKSMFSPEEALSSGAISLCLSPRKNGNSTLVAYDALVFFSPEEEISLSAFPPTRRLYAPCPSGSDDAVRTIVDLKSIDFLKPRNGDTIAKKTAYSARPVSGTINMCAYHNVANGREKLTPVTLDVGMRSIKPTDTKIRLEYYPLSFRVYASVSPSLATTRIASLVNFMSTRNGEGQAALEDAGLVGLVDRKRNLEDLTVQDIEISKAVQAMKTLPSSNAFDYSESDDKLVGVMLGYRALFNSNEGHRSIATLKQDEKGADFKQMVSEIRQDIHDYTANFGSDCCVLFVGHADSTGNEPENNRLSAQRSIVCMDLINGGNTSRKSSIDGQEFIVERTLPCYSGDEKSRVTIPCTNFGSGSRMPVGDNDTDIGKSLNRRAEVFLIWRKGTRTHK